MWETAVVRLGSLLTPERFSRIASVAAARINSLACVVEVEKFVLSYILFYSWICFCFNFDCWNLWGLSIILHSLYNFRLNSIFFVIHNLICSFVFHVFPIYGHWRLFLTGVVWHWKYFCDPTLLWCFWYTSLSHNTAILGRSHETTSPNQ